MNRQPLRYLDRYLRTWLSAFVLIGCQSLKTPSAPSFDLRQLYEAAIVDAMAPTAAEAYVDLVAITADNQELVRKNIDGETYLLVVTWKQNVSYYQPYLDTGFYNTGDYPIWVTAAPELRNRMKTQLTDDVDLRLKQLLGLPPSSEYSYFVEFWVKPEDLFRPCPDNEITDRQCNLCFPDSADESYKTWINHNRVSRYYGCELYDKYPWTQLGYTYDWHPDNSTHQGLSEFVIGTDKQIVVEGIYPTSEYLAQ